MYALPLNLPLGLPRTRVDKLKWYRKRHSQSSLEGIMKVMSQHLKPFIRKDWTLEEPHSAILLPKNAPSPHSTTPCSPSTPTSERIWGTQRSTRNTSAKPAVTTKALFLTWQDYWTRNQAPKGRVQKLKKKNIWNFPNRVRHRPLKLYVAPQQIHVNNVAPPGMKRYYHPDPPYKYFLLQF